MNSSPLPETSSHYQGPLMYLIIEQEKCEGGCLIIVVQTWKSGFTEVGDSCSLSPLSYNKEIGPNLSEKEASYGGV